MTTASLTIRSKRGLLIAALVALLGLGNLAAVPPTLTVALTGGDAGQGLTLDAGNVVTAWDIRGTSVPYTLQGVVFTNRTTGIYFNGTFAFGGGETSPNDLALAALLNSGAWDGYGIGPHLDRAPLTFTFSGLTANATYRLDLIQSTLGATSREQAIVVNGLLVTIIPLTQNVAYNTTFLTTAKENGEIDLLMIESGDYGGEGIQDGAVLNGLVLSSVAAIPEPATYAALLGLGALSVAVWRRRKVRAV